MNAISQIRPYSPLNTLENLLNQPSNTVPENLLQLKSKLAKLQLSQLIQGTVTKNMAISNTSPATQIQKILEDSTLDNKEKKAQLEKIRESLGMSKKEFKQSFIDPLKVQYQEAQKAINAKIDQSITQVQSDIAQLQTPPGNHTQQISQLQNQLAQLNQQKVDTNKLYNERIGACKIYKTSFWDKIKGAFKKVGGFIGKVKNVITKVAPYFAKAAQIYTNPASLFLG